MLNVHTFKRQKSAVNAAADAIEALAEQLIGKARQMRNHADSADWTDAEMAVRFANKLAEVVR
jgi:hypothetical protein